jgi:pimeloyl-ACP methyl ester carboxylesterase
VASARAQLAALVRGGVLRSGADETYAHSDDAAWMDVDWASLQRPLELLGRRVNVLDTQSAPPTGTGTQLAPPTGTGTQLAPPTGTGTQFAPPTGTGTQLAPSATTPLLFLHGWNSNWQVFLLNIAAFMGTHRCLALDLPGFGHSEMPSEPISIQGYAKTVDAMCDALGVESVAVIAHSMGGFIGAELALSFSTRVRRLVLISAAGLSSEQVARTPLLATARVLAAAIQHATRFESTVVRRPRARRWAMQFAIQYPEKLSVPLAQELVLSAGKPGFVPAFKALLSYSHRPRLAQIEIPVLVVWGRNDLLVPVTDAFAYQRLIGDNARVEIFEDTGHVPMLERPTRFNDLLRAFLAGEPRPESEVPGVTGSQVRRG